MTEREHPQVEFPDLVNAARDGDADSFARLVTRLQDSAVAYAYYLVRNLDAAQDIAQEAFIEAYRCLPTLRHPGAFQAWFRKIIFKHADRLRRGGRGTAMPLDEIRNVAGGAADPSQQAIRNEQINVLRRAIEALPAREREAVLLCYMEDHSGPEAAEFLGVPLSTIKNRLASARKKIQEEVIKAMGTTPRNNRPSRNRLFVTRVKALLDAIASGKADKVEDLLESDPGITAAEGPRPDWDDNLRALHVAVTEGQEDIVRLLLKKGVDVNAATAKTHWNALHLALQNRKLARLLIRSGAEVGAYAAAGLGDLEALQILIGAKPLLVRAKGPDGATPLHFAASPAVVDFLITKNADINAHDTYHRSTPLKWQIARRTVVRQLLKHGAQVDIFAACALGDAKRVEHLLLSKPADISAEAYERDILRGSGFPLHYAARYGRRSVVELLLKQGADIDARSRDGSQALHDAAYSGSVETVEALLEAGADLNDRDSCYGATPLGVAKHFKRLEMANHLQNRGAQ